jgi:predicted sulfurtransferase
MFCHISGYLFTELPSTELVTRRQQLKTQADTMALKGTILLSVEGINVFLSAPEAQIDAYVSYLKTYPEWSQLSVKKSFSHEVIFKRMLVKIKKEIITLGHPEVIPAEHTAPYISPEELKQWYESGQEFVILDTRNDYEAAVGSFDQALTLPIQHFTQFPDAINTLPPKLKNKPVVTFCTGGIRCEKAAEWMQQQGFQSVYQLEGGILNYFEKVGGAHYHGECFVFDQRLTVNPALEATQTMHCVSHPMGDQDCEFCQHMQKSRLNLNQQMNQQMNQLGESA